MEQKNYYCSSSKTEFSHKISDIYEIAVACHSERGYWSSGRRAAAIAVKFHRNSECTRESKNKHGGHSGRSHAILR